MKVSDNILEGKFTFPEKMKEDAINFIKETL